MQLMFLIMQISRCRIRRESGEEKNEKANNINKIRCRVPRCVRARLTDKGIIFLPRGIAVPFAPTLRVFFFGYNPAKEMERRRELGGGGRGGAPNYLLVKYFRQCVILSHAPNVL